MLIGVDHGNKQIKTVHCTPFVSGLQQSMTRPFGPSLQYGGNYYTLSNERIPYRKDKTGDDRFFILTLIAIAEELTARGVDEKELYHIQLPVGLPPAHFGAQAEKFTAYFQKKGIVEFQYRDKHYAISIDDVACYPQAYAAAATMLHTLMNEAKAVVVDIGGFTADYLLMKNGKADLSSCDSLENGVILLYNKIRSRGNAELDLLLDEGDVDAILTGKQTQYPPSVVRLVEQLAQEFVNDLFSTLRERMLDLRYCTVVFVGGGAILLRRQIEASGKVGKPLFVSNINANAAGYEYHQLFEQCGGPLGVAFAGLGNGGGVVFSKIPLHILQHLVVGQVLVGCRREEYVVEIIHRRHPPRTRPRRPHPLPPAQPAPSAPGRPAPC
ncbi:ParM/StbA family protein [Allofournierella massiliensis]|uniref:ParM/StbA family protein n=1 Tax=Allofournierella massiliensis TaxID=1650663 RepID=UPI00356330C5